MPRISDGALALQALRDGFRDGLQTGDGSRTAMETGVGRADGEAAEADQQAAASR